MSRFDHSDLDGHALQLLLAVHEEGSITRAAQRLGVTQSAVSHALDKLRAIVGDALFVKCGRGIVATAQADALVPRARRLLDELRSFSLAAGFDPARLQAGFTIAANDLQCDLLLPTLLRRLRALAPGVSLRVVASGAPQPALLRDPGCDLAITPRPPEGADIVQKRLFEDGYAVFFDAGQRAAPADRAAYLEAEHVTVLHETGRGLDIDDWLAGRGLRRHVVASVPAFAGIAAMLRGGPWLATLPSLLGQGVLHGLGRAPVPLPTPRMPMYAAWHLGRQADPAHQWLRATLEQVARDVVSAPAAPLAPSAPARPPPR